MYVGSKQMYTDFSLTSALVLWREQVLNDLLSDRSPCDIAEDLSFYEGLDIYLAQQVVDLVEAGE